MTIDELIEQLERARETIGHGHADVGVKGMVTRDYATYKQKAFLDRITGVHADLTCSAGARRVTIVAEEE